MSHSLPLLAAALFTLLAEPPPMADDRPRFPSLHTTLVDPQADKGPLTLCATLGGRPMCEDELLDAWCRKHGFAGYVDLTTAPPGPGCGRDDRACTVVRTITCRGVPIVGD